MKDRKNIVNLLLILGILWFVFGCVCSKKTTDSAPANLTLHAAELVREFEENEARSQQLYQGKRVRIYGTVNIVKSDNSGGFILIFNTSANTYHPLQCYFSEKYSEQLAQIRRNQEATVEGTVHGFNDSNFFLVLDSCSIP